MVKVIRDQEVIQEAVEILLEHMEPERVARFWTLWQPGSGNYLELREQLFGAENVNSLFEKVKAYQDEQGPE